MDTGAKLRFKKRKVADTSLPVVIDESAVEALVGTRAGAVREFCVKWAGRPSSDNTWEPITRLERCSRHLNAFNARGKAMGDDGGGKAVGDDGGGPASTTSLQTRFVAVSMYSILDLLGAAGIRILLPNFRIGHSWSANHTSLFCFSKRLIDTNPQSIVFPVYWCVRACNLAILVVYE